LLPGVAEQPKRDALDAYAWNGALGQAACICQTVPEMSACRACASFAAAPTCAFVCCCGVCKLVAAPTCAHACWGTLAILSTETQDPKSSLTDSVPQTRGYWHMEAHTPPDTE